MPRQLYLITATAFRDPLLTCRLLMTPCIRRLQLERTFTLSEGSTELKITTTFTCSETAPGLVRFNHWGRTFVPGGGLCMIPLPEAPVEGYSRFPNKYGYGYGYGYGNLYTT